MPATLSLTRDGFFVELRRGRFDALIDDTPVGSLDWHDTLDVPVDAGHHTLHIRRGRYSSPRHSFDAADGETVAFRLHGANLWPVFVVSLVKPDLGISLKRVG